MSLNLLKIKSRFPGRRQTDLQITQTIAGSTVFRFGKYSVGLISNIEMAGVVRGGEGWNDIH